MYIYVYIYHISLEDNYYDTCVYHGNGHIKMFRKISRFQKYFQKNHVTIIFKENYINVVFGIAIFVNNMSTTDIFTFCCLFFNSKKLLFVDIFRKN